MFDDLLGDIAQEPEISQLFLARLNDGSDTLAGARVIDSTGYDFINYEGLPTMTSKRFAVLPGLRSMGIGRRLINEGKRFSFEEQGFKATFGASNEVGALALYGRAGALYSLERLRAYSEVLQAETLEETVAVFVEHLTDPEYKEHRYPIYEGIHFAYCADGETADFFRSRGYASRDELLAMAERAG